MRVRTGLASTAALALLLTGCGLKSGSPLVDDVRPGSLGKGQPLKGASLTVTSKNFSENIILGQIMGLLFKAAGAEVLDRTNLPGSISSREAVVKGEADALYDYTGTAWITYLGHAEPVVDPQKQYEVVRDEDKGNGVTWLPPSTLDNTYALAISKKNNAKYHLKTLSDVAALAKKDPKAVTVCVENEFASRDDGLPGMQKKYGMNLPASNIQKMDAGIIYTQVSESNSCLLGEVYTTDGRIKAMNLDVMEDDKQVLSQLQRRTGDPHGDPGQVPGDRGAVGPGHREADDPARAGAELQGGRGRGGPSRGREGLAAEGRIHQGGLSGSAAGAREDAAPVPLRSRTGRCLLPEVPAQVGRPGRQPEVTGLRPSVWSGCAGHRPSVWSGAAGHRLPAAGPDQEPQVSSSGPCPPGPGHAARTPRSRAS